MWPGGGGKGNWRRKAQRIAEEVGESSKRDVEGVPIKEESSQTYIAQFKWEPDDITYWQHNEHSHAL